MSLLKPKLITTEIPPMVGIRVNSSTRFSTCTHYSWVTDPDFLGKDDSVTVVADDFLQAWHRLLELHPCEPGTSRVFPIASPYHVHVPASLMSALKEFSDSIPRLHGYSSTDTPYSAHIVAFHKPVITSVDPSTILDLIRRYGQLPSIEAKLPDDPLFPVVLSKSRFHPGSLPIFMDDANGRIRSRRNTALVSKSLAKYPLGELLNPSWQPFLSKLSSVFTALLQRLSDRQRGVFHKSPYREPNCSSERYNGFNTSAFRFHNIAQRSGYFSQSVFHNQSPIDDIEANTIHVIDDVFDEPAPSNIFFRLCKQDRELRKLALEFCLTFTSFTPTLFYLVDELQSKSSTRSRTLRIAFAVARLVRHLTPTPQEIRHVRERQPDFPDPDPYLAALRKRRE